MTGVTLVALLTLGACTQSPAGVARATATPLATVTATAMPSGTPPTQIAGKPGDTAICAVISPDEFSHVDGATATEITSGATEDTLTGLAEVYCIYADTSVSHQYVGRGTMNYEFASDTQTAAAIFARVKQSFGGASDVTGVGDAAFIGTPGGASSGTGLVVLRGTLLLYVSVQGDAQTVTRVATALALLALSRVA